MRVLALLTTIFILPIIALLVTILYGGISSTVIKEELAKTGVYEKIISFVREPSSDDAPSDPQADAVFAIIENHLTPSYAQEKVEGVVDDTSAWITGKSPTPPTLSFKELKDEIVAKNPTLLADIEQITTEMQAEQDPEAAQLQEQKNELTNFIKNDFSFPLTDQVTGIKQAYTTMSIAFPTLIVLLILSVAALVFLNKSWKQRVKWLGTTFILAGVWCYLMLLLSQFTSDATKQFILNLADENDIQFASAALERLFSVFINQQTNYQTQISIASVVLGIALMCSSFIFKASAATPTSSVKKKKTSA